MMYRTVAFIVSLLFGVLITSGAQTIGQVSYLQGGVTLMRGNQRFSQQLTIGFSVENLDLIHTGPGAEMVITTEASSGAAATITVSSDTTFTLDLGEVASPDAGSLELMTGSLALAVKRLGGGSTLDVQSSNATMGIRGTIFTVDAAESGDLLLAVEEGRVSCTTARGSVFYAEPGSVVQGIGGSWDNVTVAPAQLAFFRRRWRERRIAFLRSHASAVLKVAAAAYLERRRAFERSYERLHAHRAILDRWIREARQGSFRPARFRRDLAVIANRLLSTYQHMLGFQHLYYRVLLLEGFYHRETASGRIEAVPAASRFFAAVDRDRTSLPTKMREVRFALRFERERLRRLNRENRVR